MSNIIVYYRKYFCCRILYAALKWSSNRRRDRDCSTDGGNKWLEEWGAIRLSSIGKVGRVLASEDI
jgi:hypothetical protein